MFAQDEWAVMTNTIADYYGVNMVIQYASEFLHTFFSSVCDFVPCALKFGD
jgi:hypothetical protein